MIQRRHWAVWAPPWGVCGCLDCGRHCDFVCQSRWIDARRGFAGCKLLLCGRPHRYQRIYVTTNMSLKGYVAVEATLTNAFSHLLTIRSTHKTTTNFVLTFEVWVYNNINLKVIFRHDKNNIYNIHLEKSEILRNSCNICFSSRLHKHPWRRSYSDVNASVSQVQPFAKVYIYTNCFKLSTWCFIIINNIAIRVRFLS